MKQIPIYTCSLARGNDEWLGVQLGIVVERIERSVGRAFEGSERELDAVAEMGDFSLFGGGGAVGEVVVFVEVPVHASLWVLLSC